MYTDLTTAKANGVLAMAFYPEMKEFGITTKRLADGTATFGFCEILHGHELYAWAVLYKQTIHFHPEVRIATAPLAPQQTFAEFTSTKHTSPLKAMQAVLAAVRERIDDLRKGVELLEGKINVC